MAAIALGRGSYFGFGDEVTYGTPVARTIWVRAMPCSGLKRDIEKVERPVLAHGSTGGNIMGHYRKIDKVSGTVKFLMGYEGVGLILRHCMWGTFATTGPVSSIYTHTIKLGLNPPTGGLTIEQFNGDLGQAEVFEGCRVVKAKLSLAAGGLMEVELEIMGETSAGRVAAGTPTLTTNELDVLASQAGSLTWNSVANAVIRSIALEIDNRLAERQNVGSLTPADPKPSAPRSIKCILDVEYNDETFQAGFIADTSASATITFTGTGSRTIAVTMHNSYVESDAVGPDSYGVLMQKTTLRSQESSSTNTGLTLVIANTQVTAELA